MLYELSVRPGTAPGEVELLHDNANEALQAVRLLSERVSEIQITRDGEIISEEQLASDAEIQDSEKWLVDRLPATSQPGYGSESDIAIAHDGRPVKVRRPSNLKITLSKESKS